MEPMQGIFNASNGGKSEPKSEPTHSTDLLDVGKTLNDPLLIRKKKPYKMPPSSVLSQVKSFLPMMQEANSRLEEQLKTTPAEDLDIENVQDCGQEVIEMNLAVFAHDDSSSDEDGILQGDTSSDEDSENEVVSSFGEVTADNIRLPNQPKTSKRTMIEDLSTGTGVKVHDPRSQLRPEEEGRRATASPSNDGGLTLTNGQHGSETKTQCTGTDN